MVVSSHCSISDAIAVRRSTSVGAVGIQWLESSRQRDDLKLVLNRLVRTRMLGGVGGVPEQSGPLSRSALFAAYLDTSSETLRRVVCSPVKTAFSRSLRIVSNSSIVHCGFP